MTFTLIAADCIEAMQAMAENSVDAIVTDPPYNLSFMGKAWDGPGDHKPWATEALRILKPGGHLLAFGGTRTYHRLACAIEDAGFEIRDCIAWMYGSGFPKSLDVSKAIDKAAGAEREVVGSRDTLVGQGGTGAANFLPDADRLVDITAPATPEAQRWNGWGTALKPAFEPIVLARKPLSERNVAANVQRWGTGALNVDGCRIGMGENEDRDKLASRSGGSGEKFPNGIYQDGMDNDGAGWKIAESGRWPANVTLGHSPDCEPTDETRKVKGDPREPQDGERPGGFFDVGSENGNGKPAGPLYGDASVQVWNCAPGCAVAMLDEQTGERPGFGGFAAGSQTHGADRNAYGFYRGDSEGYALTHPGYGDTGGASRFFYCPKADREERNRGLEHMAQRSVGIKNDSGRGFSETDPYRDIRAANHHPTVKPVELMRWLCRMVTPKGGTVLDPFTGSGSTGVAAMREGFEFIGIEREAEYVEIARARIIGDAPLFNLEAVGGGPTE